MDGWNLDDFDDLNNVLGDIYDTQYEIEHYARGRYTGCTTYAELADHLNYLAHRLTAAAHYLANIEEEKTEKN